MKDIMNNIIVKNCTLHPKKMNVVLYDGTNDCVRQLQIQFADNKYPQILRCADMLEPNSYIVWKEHNVNVYDKEHFDQLYNFVPSKIRYTFTILGKLKLLPYTIMESLMKELEAEYYEIVCMTTNVAEVKNTFSYPEVRFSATHNEIEIIVPPDEKLISKIYKAVDKQLKVFGCNDYKITQQYM